MSNQGETANTPIGDQAATPGAAALAKLKEWDPAWAEHSARLATNLRTEGVLSTKFIELLCVALHAAQANRNPADARQHVRAAIAAGATRQEILFVLKCASLMSVHSCTFAAPILLHEASVGSLEDFGKVRAERAAKVGQASTAVEKMKAIGLWNDEWDALLFLAPRFTNEYMEMCREMYEEKVFSEKELQLLLIAFDASYPRMSVAYVRQHIKNAFRAGATTDEIVQVLKVTAVQGMEDRNLGVAILGEELERNPLAQRASATS